MAFLHKINNQLEYKMEEDPTYRDTGMIFNIYE